MKSTIDLNNTISIIRNAFQYSNWSKMNPVTRNYILWDTHHILELEEVDESIKDVLRKERQAAIALIRERILNALDIA